MKRWLMLSILTGAWLPAQTLLFKSGFESNTALLAIPGSATGTSAFIQTFSGTDTSTAFAWPNIAFGPTGINGLHVEGAGSDLLVNHFLDILDTSEHHSGSRSLHTEVHGYANNTCCVQVPFQSSAFNTPIKQVYVSYWLKYPSSLSTVLNGYSGDYGRETSAFKTSHDYRMSFDVTRLHGTTGTTMYGEIAADALGQAQSIGNGCPFVDPITGATDNDCNNRFFDIFNEAYPIPIGQWFNVEFFIRRVNGPGGKFIAAVDGHIVGDFDYVYSNIGVNNEDVHDFYWVTTYSPILPIVQNLDDFEIWDAIPCANFPCRTAQTGGVPPAIKSYPAVVGAVGTAMSFQPVVTNSPTSWHYNNYGSTGLPPGLSFNTSTGLISGTPTATGIYRIFVNATSAVGNGVQILEFQINSSLQAPVIKTFAPYPTAIASGGSSTLYANVLGAGTVTLSVGQGVGALSGLSTSKIVNPTVSTTYTLTAHNAAGTATASTTVSVTGGGVAPAITMFAATPSIPVVPGTSVNLVWTSTGGATATLNGSSVALSGSQTVNPLTTTDYALVVSNSAGTASQTVTVSVGALPVISAFTASPSTVALGGSSVLTLASTGGTSCSIDQGVGAVACNSSTSVSPATSKLYTATVTNSFGSKTAQVLVGVSISALVGASVVNGQVVIH